MGKNLNRRKVFDTFQQCTFNLGSRHVLKMQDSVVGMPAFFGQVIGIALVFTVKARAIIYKFADALGGFGHHNFYHLAVVQKIACHHGIFNVFFKRIIHRPHRRNASLGILSVGFVGANLGNDGNFNVLFSLVKITCQFERIAQTCNPRTNHEEIELWHGVFIFVVGNGVETFLTHKSTYSRPTNH